MISCVHCGEGGRDETDYFSEIKKTNPKNLAQINKNRMQTFHTVCIKQSALTSWRSSYIVLYNHVSLSGEPQPRPEQPIQMLSPVWYFPSLSLFFSQFGLEAE